MATSRTRLMSPGDAGFTDMVEQRGTYLTSIHYQRAARR